MWGNGKGDEFELDEGCIFLTVPGNKPGLLLFQTLRLSRITLHSEADANQSLSACPHLINGLIKLLSRSFLIPSGNAPTPGSINKLHILSASH